MWNFKETRAAIDKAGWQYTKDVGEEYGQSPRPKAYDDVSLPRSAHKSYNKPPISSTTGDGDEDEHAVEMSGYATPYSGADSPRGDSPRGSPGPSREPAPSTPIITEPPEYAKVNKNRKKVDDEEDEADSWV